MQTIFSTFADFTNKRSDSERLLIVVTDGVEGIQLDLENERDRASVFLIQDKAMRLNQVVAAFRSAQGSGSHPPSETFYGDDGHSLVMHHTNWGEPYDEGVCFSLRRENLNLMQVSLPTSELFEVNKLLDKLGYRAEPEAQSGAAMR